MSPALMLRNFEEHTVREVPLATYVPVRERGLSDDRSPGLGAPGLLACRVQGLRLIARNQKH